MSTATASLSSPPPPDIVHRDFPGWLPPMLVKELRQGLRTRGFVGMLVVFQVIMVILMLGALSAQVTSSGAVRAAGASGTGGIFWTIIFMQLVVVTPMRAVGGLQLEVDSRTLDLLMLTRLDAWGVVLGKWISLMAQALLMLCTMLPYLVVRYFTDNADIVGDLGRCAALAGVSGILTAAGLWGSGLGKIMRVVLVIVLVWGAMSVGGAFGPRIFGMRVSPGMAGGAGISWLTSPIEILNGVVITAFFLVSAVRNIAPLAENHSFFTRLLPLITLLPAPFLAWFGTHSHGTLQLLFSGLFLALVLVFELASTRIPLASQRHAWTRRGRMVARLGLLGLPGWPSAFVYAVLACGSLALVAPMVIPDGTLRAQALLEHVLKLAPLALAGLVFPAVVRSFVPIKAPDLFFYLTVFFAPLVGLVVGAALMDSTFRFGGLKHVMDTIPVASFFSALDPSPNPRYAPTGVAVVLRNVFAIVILVLAAWRTRSYWHVLSIHDTRNRLSRPPA